MEDSARPPAVRVGHATERDLDAMARIFRAAFPLHATSAFPEALLREFLGRHRAQCVVLAARNAAGEVIGFAIGGRIAALDAARDGFLRARAPKLALEALRGGTLLRTVIGRLQAYARRPKPPRSQWQLRFIAVDEAARGLGAGAALLRGFEAALPAAEPYHAWTMAGEHGAVPFYLHLGCVVELEIDGHVRMERRYV